MWGFLPSRRASPPATTTKKSNVDGASASATEFAPDCESPEPEKHERTWLEKLYGETNQFVFRKRALPDFFNQALSLYQLHDDKAGAGFCVKVVYRRHIRMIEFGKSSGFASEASKELLITREFR
jgi:hypothetical protein